MKDKNKQNERKSK